MLLERRIMWHGETLTINRIYNEILQVINEKMDIGDIKPIYDAPRSGDIKDSLADLSEANRCLWVCSQL